MNYPDSGTATTPGKKNRFSSAARMLVLGLALVLPGAAALAGEPIPGVDVKLGKNPGGNAVAAPTGADGAYQFKGLAPGNYDLSVAGRLVQTITVGDRGSISGVLSSDGGKASITFNGQVGVVPDLPSAPVSVTRSNKKAGIAVGDVNRDGRAEIRAVPPKTDGTGKPQFKVADNESPRPTDRAFLDGNASPGIMTGAGAGGGDKLPGIVGGTLLDRPDELALRPKDEKSAVRVAVITVNPVNDAPSKAVDPIPAGFGQPVTFTATVTPVNPTNTPSGIAGDPVPGTSVGLDHDPGGPISSTKTDENGAFQFTGVPAGKYTLKLPGLPAKSVTIGDDRKIDGKVERGNDGKINVQIFLNTNITKAATIGVDSSSSLTTKASGNSVPSFPGSGFPGIGIGNVMGGILPGMTPGGGPGAGPMSPVASPMGPGGPMGASPMGPGAGAIRR